MIVHDLSPDAVGRMVRADLATATEEPESPICWRRNDAPNGVTVLYLTPIVGSRHSWEDAPE